MTTEISELEYLILCREESDPVLTKIICPHCGYVYGGQESIDFGVTSDCEGAAKIKCQNCDKNIIVRSNCTNVSFWTTKEEDGKQ